MLNYEVIETEISSDATRSSGAEISFLRALVIVFQPDYPKSKGHNLGRTAPFSWWFTEGWGWGSSTANTACTWRCGGTLLIHYNDILSYILSYVISVRWKLFTSRLRIESGQGQPWFVVFVNFHGVNAPTHGQFQVNNLIVNRVKKGAQSVQLLEIWTGSRTSLNHQLFDKK